MFKDLGFKILGLGFRVCKVYGLRFRVGLGGFGFRVLGLG